MKSTRLIFIVKILATCQKMHVEHQGVEARCLKKGVLGRTLEVCNVTLAQQDLTCSSVNHLTLLFPDIHKRSTVRIPVASISREMISKDVITIDIS